MKTDRAYPSALILQPSCFFERFAPFADAPGALEKTPLPEQRRIVAKVDQLMALVDQLEAQLTTFRATAANLLEALVAKLTAA
ncbi:hypothetical protein [Halochromatium roseum]|uniref:hypothetical protein n=1 Tax=Halochromatium roseum TaxID=391920 RepID=UPI001912FEB8|nr:hypothetical protein [Halochromatium roseum]MBK5939524.1 hypothetical protein [Halochromatium roseum]